MINRTQAEIMQSWEKEAVCAVSIVCITYNHEEFIREAIESFLMQETSFPFEIIIHDDASTDNTVKIIQEYHKNYPDIIKPILQKENQYSKGGFKPTFYAAGYSKAKYIALCEGDDYWLDVDKLSLQFRALESHPCCEFSFHPAFLEKNGVIDDIPHWQYAREESIYYLDSILSKHGQFAPTASYMVRRDVFVRMTSFIQDAPVGDIFIEMYGSQKGGALYLAKPMSVYRVASSNSWTINTSNGSDAWLSHHNKMIMFLDGIKKDFPEYSVSFGEKKAYSYLSLAKNYLNNCEYESFKQAIIQSVMNKNALSIQQKIMYRFRDVPKLLRRTMFTYRFLSRKFKKYSVRP